MLTQCIIFTFYIYTFTIYSIALEVLFGFTDGYSILADNYIMYQEGTDSNRYTYIPYDPEYSLGNTLVKLDDILTGDYRAFPGLSVQPLTSKFLLVPEFKKRFEILLEYLAVNLFNLDVLGRFIDSTVAMIQEDIRWDLSLERLSHSNFIPSGDSWPWPIDKKTVEDMTYHTFQATIPFDAAVNGPTGSISSCGVKEFIANKTRAINDFFEIYHYGS